MELLKCYSSDSEQEKGTEISDVDEYDTEWCGTTAKVQKTREDSTDVSLCTAEGKMNVPAEILRLDPGAQQTGDFKGQFNQVVTDTVEIEFYSTLRTRFDIGEGNNTRRPSVVSANYGETSEFDHVTRDVDISAIPEVIRSVENDRKTGCRSRYYFPKKCRLQLSNHKGKLNNLDWIRPYGQLLASASMDGTVLVWDPFARRKCIQVLEGHGGAVREAKWNLTGDQILSCSYDKTVKLWDVQTGKAVTSFAHPEFVTAIEFHPTLHSSYISGCFSSHISSWDIRSGIATNQYKGTIGQVQDLEFLQDGSEFLSATDVVQRSANEKSLIAWDFRSTAILSHQIFQEPYTCTCLKAHPKEKEFIAQTQGNYIAIFSSKQPYKLNKYRRFEGGHEVSGYPLSCSIRPDGLIVGSGSSDGRLVFYNYFSSKLVSSVKIAHAGPSTDVQFHPVLPSTVASCGWDCIVNIWE